ncbi:MAG TPA: tetratricopeptide repeat protein [Chondromyces sp.]|nr:tetratricopeptide repeat protein [Chondromyces sp.]
MNRPFAVLALVALSLATACASSGSESAGSASPQPAVPSGGTTTDPLSSLTYMRQGSVLMQQGRFEAALEAFQQADRIAPGNATNKNMIGLCHLRMGAFDDALAAFSQALELVPGFTDARNNRGATYLAMGQLHLAEVDFVAVLGDSTYPHRRQVYYNLAMTYLERDQLGAAIENFQKSIALPNPVFDGYLQLARLAQRQGELDRSKTLLEEARLEFPERIEVSFELGKLLILMGDEEAARPYLEQVIAGAPNSTEAATARTLLGTS